jgi:hypothetical protein
LLKGHEVDGDAAFIAKGPGRHCTDAGDDLGGQERICSVKSPFKRYEIISASLADAALIRLVVITDSPLLLTTDRDFYIYRCHGRQMIPLASP